MARPSRSASKCRPATKRSTRRTALLLLAPALLIACWGSVFSSSPMPTAMVDPVSSDGEPLTPVGRLLAKVGGVLKLPRDILEAVGGISLLVWGQEFASSVLFFQAFRTAGWPTIKHAADQASIKYLHASAPPKDKQKAYDSIPRLSEHVKQVQGALKDADVFAKEVRKDNKLWEARLKHAEGALKNAKSQAAARDAELEKKVDMARAEMDKLSQKASGVEAVKDQALHELAEIKEHLNDNMLDLLHTRELIPRIKDHQKRVQDAFREAQKLAEMHVEHKQWALRHDHTVEALREEQENSAQRIQALQHSVHIAAKEVASLAEKAQEAAQVKQKAVVELREATAELDEAIRTTSNLKAAIASIDPAHIGECARGLTQGAAACVAAAASPVIRSVCVGADLSVHGPGRLLAPIVGKITGAEYGLPAPTHSNWTRGVATSAMTAAAAYAAFQLQDVTVTVAACALGAQAVANSVSSRLSLVANSTARNALEGLLLTTGVAAQLRMSAPTASRIPGPARGLLGPAIRAEEWFTDLIAGVTWR